MIAVVLLFILAGSFGTAILLAASEASWTAIALGYVAGGGAGFVVGGVLVIGTRCGLRQADATPHRHEFCVATRSQRAASPPERQVPLRT